MVLVRFAVVLLFLEWKPSRSRPSSFAGKLERHLNGSRGYLHRFATQFEKFRKVVSRRVSSSRHSKESESRKNLAPDPQ